MFPDNIAYKLYFSARSRYCSNRERLQNEFLADITDMRKWDSQLSGTNLLKNHIIRLTKIDFTVFERKFRKMFLILSH